MFWIKNSEVCYDATFESHLYYTSLVWAKNTDSLKRPKNNGFSGSKFPNRTFI